MTLAQLIAFAAEKRIPLNTELVFRHGTDRILVGGAAEYQKDYYAPIELELHVNQEDMGRVVRYLALTQIQEHAKKVLQIK